MRALRTPWVLLPAVLLGGGFYLLLIDTASLPELYVLAGVVVASTLGYELSREQGFVESRIVPSWLVAVWRVIAKIPGDIVGLSAEAVIQLVSPRQSRGTFRAVRFGACDDTPADAGRRALTEWLGSLAPNTIVVGIDSERGRLVVHQLRRRGEPDQLDPLRLG